MATGRGISGGRRHDVFSVTIGTTQTTLTSTTPVYTCTEQISSDGAMDDQGARTWTVDQIQASSSYWTFVQTYAPPAGASGGTPEDLTMEDGELISGAQSTGTTVGLLVRGPLISGTESDGARLSWGGLVKVSRASSAINFSGNTYVKPSLIYIATAITTDFIIPTAVLGSYMTTAATQTLSATTHRYGKVIIG